MTWCNAKIKGQAQKKHTVITKIWKSSEASVSGRYNTPPLQEDLVPRSRMAPERNGREEVKQIASLTNEWNHEPWEVNNLKKNTMEMNAIATTPLEKRKKEHCENLVGWRTWNKCLTDQKEYESTPVEKRNKEHHVNLEVNWHDRYLNHSG